LIQKEAKKSRLVINLLKFIAFSLKEKQLARRRASNPRCAYGRAGFSFTPYGAVRTHLRNGQAYKFLYAISYRPIIKYFGTMT
jgi:hypothetical protein